MSRGPKRSRATADAHRVALFVVKPDHHLVVGADDRRLVPSAADTVLSLVGG